MTEARVRANTEGPKGLVPRADARAHAMNGHDASAWHLISREIGIDAGHRVMDHQSKCRNLHGHRYRIEAWCRGPLFVAGEQNGMVLDFGFLKEEMMREIDARFDHAFMFSIHDVVCREMFGLSDFDLAQTIDTTVERKGLFFGLNPDGLKICVLPIVPTAENLAKLWFDLLEPRVIDRTSGHAELTCVKVWETPNCWAAYGPGAPH